MSGKRKPQAIAHRGYKAKFPENTMGAFKGAVEVGAEAIETDVHLSRDGVVVLSHVSSPSILSVQRKLTRVGQRLEEVLWATRKDHRLRLRVPEQAENAEGAARIDASSHRFA